MVPDYDDDDVIEDYEEVQSESAVRRVNSGQGGPVKRPPTGGAARPQTSAMPALDDEGRPMGPSKGKITQKQAKLIWIICIVIVVLGLGAVGTDYVLNKNKGGGGNTVDPNVPANNRRTGLPPEHVQSPREKLESEFVTAVVGKMGQMDGSKAWDFYWTSVLEFDASYEKAKALKSEATTPSEELEAAWADTIKHYYKAKYAADLFRFHFGESKVDFFAINIRSKDDLSMLNDDELKNDAIRTFQAASSKIDAKSTNVNKFKTDILKYDLTAQKVHESQEWADKVFGEYKNKWELETSKKEFAQEDIDFVDGPDYTTGQEKMWEAFLKANGG
ncbi:MAG: hypothetical protein H6839_09575 [Planctomycetes bacterium]|nr:hypothetical protein [Planctomycetota bacterium]